MLVNLAVGYVGNGGQLRHHCVRLLDLVSRWSQRPSDVSSGNKKAGVIENPQVPNHAGLLFDGPPAIAGLPFV